MLNSFLSSSNTAVREDSVSTRVGHMIKTKVKLMSMSLFLPLHIILDYNIVGSFQCFLFWLLL